MTRSTLLVLCGAAFLTACADAPVAPLAPIPDSTSDAKRSAGVAALGTLVELNGSTLVLEQRGLEGTAAPGVTAGSATYTPSIGRVGERLQVLLNTATQFYANGERVSVTALAPGQRLVVAGTREGDALRAVLVGDLADMRPATQARTIAADPATNTAAAPAPDVTAAADELSLCLGQLMDYFADNTVDEFHGCWGGPSGGGIIDLNPNPTIGCGVVGCWVIDWVSLTIALAGASYDFPFRTSASSPGLVYHVPGTVSLGLTPLPASGSGFTYAGGAGFDIGFGVQLCPPVIFDCFDVFEYHLNEFSLIHQAKGPAPLRASNRLDMASVACFPVAKVPIPDTPFALEVAVCQDIHLEGRAFSTRVQFDGARAPNDAVLAFEGANQARTVTPDALFVDVSYREFAWTPEMVTGFSAQLNLDPIGLTLVQTPTLDVGSGSWPAVSTPFPDNVPFTLARDPTQPLELLFQPLAISVARIPVAPAPTTLTIISSPTLEEGSPVEARLTESFDGSPITNHSVRFTVTNANGTQATSSLTDVAGIARLVLPNGEHTVRVNFDGSQFYLPSAAGPQQVFVYQPTTFVIWGGNAGGIALGERYNFWGSQWHKQVTGGDFTANASFKGYAHTATATSWIAGGGNSTRPPDHLGGLIGVIVSTSITRQGESTLGNIVQRVILRVENPRSYRPNPGHEGFGTFVTIIGAVPLT